jgi:hypothetical protein
LDFLGIECSLCLAVVAVGGILNEDTLRERISICGVVWLGSLTFSLGLLLWIGWGILFSSGLLPLLCGLVWWSLSLLLLIFFLVLLLFVVFMNSVSLLKFV